MTNDTVFPASFAQRRLWFIQTMTPRGTAYNMLFQVELPGPFDAAALQAALNDLVARHEPLRTRFECEDGEPVQVVAPSGELQLVVHDLRVASDAGVVQRELASVVSSMVSEPFTLPAAPLARAALGIISGDRAIFTLVIHHIVVDGTSIQILADELGALYQARMDRQVALLPEAPVQYGDFAAWQRQMLSGQRLDRLADYWRRRLDGLVEIDLAPHRARQTSDNARGGLHPFSIRPDIVGRLRALSADARTTLFAALLSAWSAVLARHTGESSLPIGIPVSGRPRPELERVVGPFINSMVMRADVSGRPTFRELVLRIGAALAEDLTHQDLPFDLLVDRLHWPRHPGRNPIFQVMFQLQVSHRRHGARPGAQSFATGKPSNGLTPEALTSQVDMSCIQYEADDGSIEGGLVYAADLFDERVVATIVSDYTHLLAHAADDANVHIDTVRTVGAASARGPMSIIEGEKREWPDQMLDDWFLRQAMAAADRPAVVWESEAGTSHVTFSALAAAANAYAAALERAGVSRGQIVAIVLPRAPELVAAVLGVLQAGAAYVCLDPHAPAERRAFIVSDCDAAAVVVPPGGEAAAFGRPCIVSGGVPIHAEHVVVPGRSAHDAAYVIYTSGSTGRPKGVVIPHAAIVNHMHWMLDRFPITEADRVLQRTPLTFDASVWELFAPLLAGAQLVLAPEQRAFDPAALADVIVRQRITTLQVVPSLLRALTQSRQLDRCVTLRRLFCGGEPLTADLRDAVFGALPVELCNLYGPTETTIDSTFHLCERDDRRPVVPIGRPIANAVARVVDPGGVAVPPGTAGELYIEGAPVCTGYLNRPELTAERFVDSTGHPHGRMFRTGDRVRMLTTGELEFLGRLDEQLKVRGFRVEPGEIEAVLTHYPRVADCAVVVQEHDASDARLVAFVVPATSDVSAGDTSVLSRGVTAWLRERLPAHLVPSLIAVVDTLPRTRHGKVDRVALRTMSITRLVASDALFTPHSDLERMLCRAFEEVLKVPAVGPDDDFFHLGGHSLLVLSLRDRLMALTPQHVDVVDVFEYPTPRRLARELGARAAASASTTEAVR